MKSIKLFQKAIELRKKGFSFREINERLGISKSTASQWTGRIELSRDASRRIEGLKKQGRIKSSQTLRIRRLKQEKIIEEKVKKIIADSPLTKNHLKLICSLLYCCEGGKNEGGRINFINSDPLLVSYFLKILRRSFVVDEKKFRALIHLHDYHNEKKQISYWSKITKIQPSQFSKSFLKKNVGKNKRKNYQGCISIRYYDSNLYKELIILYKKLLAKK